MTLKKQVMNLMINITMITVKPMIPMMKIKKQIVIIAKMLKMMTMTIMSVSKQETAERLIKTAAMMIMKTTAIKNFKITLSAKSIAMSPMQTTCKVMIQIHY